MRICIATTRPADFAVFLAAWRALGAEVTMAATGQAALDRATGQAPDLFVVDEDLPDTDPFRLVAGLMRHNAAIATAVVSRLAPEDFHEAGEGLGILSALPPKPTADDARALCDRLAALARLASGLPA